ncbi:hypothetical protein [Nostoc sp.]|uniref:hypothetical protein n=1 Tax=Nostoc sp. TaxID=1180 RepID=UPI002FF91006
MPTYLLLMLEGNRSEKQKPVTQNSKTGAAFITGKTVAGGFGAVGIGATPVVGAGAVAGAAAYGNIA